jgi:hypothetical protein
MIRFMTWELDHFFVATTDAAAAEQEMAAFGLTFTRRSVHAGQGTANVCASFEGTFLEIVHAHDAAELRAPVVRPLGLDERIRWRETGACPFGLAFRPTDADSDAASWPFSTWGYEAPYLPPGMTLPVVTPPDRFDEPLIFVLRRPKAGKTGWGAPPPTTSPAHRGARRAVTRLAVQRAPGAPPLSAGVRWLADQGLFALGSGAAPLLEVEWDGGREGGAHRFSDAAPLLLRW